MKDEGRRRTPLKNGTNDIQVTRGVTSREPGPLVNAKHGVSQTPLWRGLLGFCVLRP